MVRANYINETRVLREIRSNPACRVRYTRHSELEMLDDDVTESDVDHVLTNGHVTLIETNKPEITWRVEGRDIDGRHLHVLAVVYEDEIKIKVITVFE